MGRLASVTWWSSLETDSAALPSGLEELKLVNGEGAPPAGRGKRLGL